MNRSLTRGASALALALVLSLPARAATTTTPVTLSNTAYTDLGVGPMRIAAAGGDVVYQIADTQPSIVIGGTAINQGSSADLTCVTAHVWARSTNNAAGTALVTAGTGLTCGGGGGGGGGAATIADGADVTEGAQADAAYSGSGTATVVAALKGLYAKLSAVGVTGTLPAFAVTPTVNLGTIGAAATAANQTTLLTALGSPFQAGGSIGNTSFGISGTLPAFASTPTVNLGTLNGAATAALETTINTTLGSPFQAGGSIGNTSFGISGTLPAFAATPAFQGATASGATATENPLFNGGRAQNAENTAVTNGQKVGLALDLAGKSVTSPFANRENFLNCAVTDNANTATTCTGMGAQGGSVKIYITDLCLTRSDTGTAAISATLNDSATTILDLPNSGGGGGICKAYNVPLQVAANTAFQVTISSATTSVHISASGYKGY